MEPAASRRFSLHFKSPSFKSRINELKLQTLGHHGTLALALSILEV